MLSYTLDYAAFFLSPFGYHLVSILARGAASRSFSRRNFSLDAAWIAKAD
jgi:hypothetical protein